MTEQEAKNYCIKKIFDDTTTRTFAVKFVNKLGVNYEFNR